MATDLRVCRAECTLLTHILGDSTGAMLQVLDKHTMLSKQILHPTSGMVVPGELMALVGPCKVCRCDQQGILHSLAESEHKLVLLYAIPSVWQRMHAAVNDDQKSVHVSPYMQCVGQAHNCSCQADICIPTCRDGGPRGD